MANVIILLAFFIFPFVNRRAKCSKIVIGERHKIGFLPNRVVEGEKIFAVSMKIELEMAVGFFIIYMYARQVCLLRQIDVRQFADENFFPESILEVFKPLGFT